MKKRFKFNKISLLSIFLIMICVFMLTSCGSKYGQKTAYLEYSSANSGGCSGNSQILSKSDWLKNYIEEGVESSVNSYLNSIKNETYYTEATAAVESIKLTGVFNGAECKYVDADGKEITVKSYLSNLEKLFDNFIDADNKKAIANTDNESEIAEHFQVCLIENDIKEFKNYVVNIKKADLKSIDNVKTALNGTAGCFDTSSEKEAIKALNNVENVDDVYLLGALFLIKIDDRLMEAEPVSFKARTVGEFFGSFWNNIFIFPVAWLLYQISNLCGGYYIIGLLLTTLLVRTLGWPIYAKSNNMSQKMSELQPELQKIQEKYAGRNDADSQRMMQMEQAQLYKKNKIGIGGCLAPFLQFPIFMAVYNAISRLPYTKAIEGSRYTLNWANELNGSLFGVNLFEDRNGGGSNQLIGVIVLVLLVVGTQILSQFLSQQRAKKAQEKRQEDIPAYRRQSYNQTQNQSQNTMKYMLWFMIFMMGSFVWTSKAGLGVYWFIGNIYSVVQMFVNNYLNDKKAAKKDAKGSTYTIYPNKTKK